MSRGGYGKQEIPLFDRKFFGSGHTFSRIGDGELGGKASGLIFVQQVLDAETRAGAFQGFQVAIPKSTVITTEFFDLFIERNGLQELTISDAADDRVAHAFQRAELPVEIVGDLRALIENVHTPLAVRSSSLLEDALFRPFAGVYATKMTPNNQPDAATRFRRLVEAIKLVYASTFFSGAKDYIRATDRKIEDERMAVIVQEVVGNLHGERFYPEASGVGRSHNFYPMSGATPEDGVVNLALGLGKTIVDGEVSWIYAPPRPNAPPPFASVSDLMKKTQLEFWAVNMGRPPEYDPTLENEYLARYDLAAADYDGALDWIASTYDPGADRLFAGTGRTGPRVLTFAPLLDTHSHRLNDVITKLLAVCRQALGTPIEMEFALRLPCPGGPPSPEFGFLQVRPMVVSDAPVVITKEEFVGRNLLVRSNRVMGNGVADSITDVLYVLPQSFKSLHTQSIATELGKLNRRLVDEGRHYVLIGFGRWGSADPALGIPVQWGQISGARVIVEATLPEMNVEPSQGSHFFHNITSFKVSYFHVHHDDKQSIDWGWLASQPAVKETDHVRHIRLESPLVVKVDGTTSRGGIWH